MTACLTAILLANFAGFPFGATNAEHDVSRAWRTYNPVSQEVAAVSERASVLGSSVADVFTVEQASYSWMSNEAVTVVWTNIVGTNIVVTNRITTNSIPQQTNITFTSEFNGSNTFVQQKNYTGGDGTNYTAYLPLVPVDNTGKDMLQHISATLWENRINSNQQPALGECFLMTNKADAAGHFTNWLNSVYVWTNNNGDATTNSRPWPMWNLADMVYYQQTHGNSNFGHIVAPNYNAALDMLLPPATGSGTNQKGAWYADQNPYTCPLGQMVKSTAYWYDPDPYVEVFVLTQGWKSISMSTRFVGPATNKWKPRILAYPGMSNGWSAVSMVVTGYCLFDNTNLVLTSKTYSVSATNIECDELWGKVISMNAAFGTGQSNDTVILAYTNEFAGYTTGRYFGVNAVNLDELRQSIAPLQWSKGQKSEWVNWTVYYQKALGALDYPTLIANAEAGGTLTMSGSGFMGPRNGGTGVVISNGPFVLSDSGQVWSNQYYKINVFPGTGSEYNHYNPDHVDKGGIVRYTCTAYPAVAPTSVTNVDGIRFPVEIAQSRMTDFYGYFTTNNDPQAVYNGFYPYDRYDYFSGNASTGLYATAIAMVGGTNLPAWVTYGGGPEPRLSFVVWPDCTAIFKWTNFSFKTTN